MLLHSMIIFQDAEGLTIYEIDEVGDEDSVVIPDAVCLSFFQLSLTAFNAKQESNLYLM